jgi:hypothetical protein
MEEKMNRKRRLILFVIGLTLAVSVGIANAQGPTGTGQPRAPRTALSTGFTYQGQLKNNGTSINGSCDLAFRLYDATSGGNLIGSAITTTIPITTGMFTTQLNFGADAFTGYARWLDLQVRCPTGIGSFTGLSRPNTFNRQ